MTETSTRRNPFEEDNARNMSRRDLAESFVPTDLYWRLFSRKNHMILGSRGSGKTALAKMLSHDHLVLLEYSKAKQFVSARSFVGTIVSANLEWSSRFLPTLWPLGFGIDEYFVWKLNFKICLAFLTTLESCLSAYVVNVKERLEKERFICGELTLSWLGYQSTEEIQALTQLKTALLRMEDQRETLLENFRTGHASLLEVTKIGSPLQIELLRPLRRAIDILSQTLSFPEDTTWILVLDEAEFLTSPFRKIINDLLRANLGNISLKITCTPYWHFDHATHSPAQLSELDDFEYAYLEREWVTRAGGINTMTPLNWIRRMFRRRMQSGTARLRKLTLIRLLGPSPLLDSGKSDWSLDSDLRQLLKENASERQQLRSIALFDSEKPQAFGDQLGRKIHKFLLLRNAVKENTGNSRLSIYCGEKLFIRCSDNNPRKLMRLFRKCLDLLPPEDSIELLPGEDVLEAEDIFEAAQDEVKRSATHLFPLEPSKQTDVLLSSGRSFLDRMYAEAVKGPKIHGVLNCLGNYFKGRLHERKLETDIVSTFTIDENTPEGIVQCIHSAVDLGGVYPVFEELYESRPVPYGRFRLSYLMAPHFRLMPRLGPPVALETAMQSLPENQEKLPF